MKIILLLFTFFSFCCSILLMPRNAGSIIKKETVFSMPCKNNLPVASLNDNKFIGFNNFPSLLHIDFNPRQEPIIFDEPLRLQLTDDKSDFSSWVHEGYLHIGLRIPEDCLVKTFYEEIEEEDSCSELIIKNTPTFDTGITWVTDTCWLEDLLQTINIDSCIKEFYRHKIDFYSHDTINCYTDYIIGNIFLHGY